MDDVDEIFFSQSTFIYSNIFFNKSLVT